MFIRFRQKFFILLALFFYFIFPSHSLAGNYTTSVSPSGTEVLSPITVTFNIQDFAQKNYPIPGNYCTSSFVPQSIRYYWFDPNLDFFYLSPIITPTSEEIASGVYQATLAVTPGMEVWAVGAEFYPQPDGVGSYCGFYGNQPNGVSTEPWTAPLFTVIAPPVVSTPSVVVQRFINNPPTIVFTEFPSEKVWRGKKKVSYLAQDSDVVPGNLRNRPIDIYYSNNNGISWNAILKDETNIGSYTFDSAQLPDGIDYKVKITVTDNFNAIAEAISETLSVDNTGPNFQVEVSPQTEIKETDTVKLTITASEDLKQVPSVKITQKGGTPTTLTVSGSRKSFSASYTVLKGFSGEAVISISGIDLAGNTGEIVTAGKTFSVNRFGPPPPIVDSITDGQIFSDPNIEVSGKAIDAVEVTIILNGKTTLKAKPDTSGFFTLNLILSDENKGNNVISISSIDAAGVVSVDDSFSMKLNKSPEISLSTTLAGTISGTKEIKWLASDPNSDSLSYTIEYSIDNGKNWDALVAGLIETSYLLDTASLFDDTRYRIRVIADDGAETASAMSDVFTISNNLSFSLTGIPANYLLNTTQPVFDVVVGLAKNILSAITYSLDKERWENAVASDGKFNSGREGFRVEFPAPLLDGKYNVFFEIEDDKRIVAKTFRTFIVDTVPPIPPTITYPSASDAIDASKDSNPALSGIQVDIRGKSEAGAVLQILVNSRRYETIGTSKGEFVFKNVTLLSRGVNRYTLTSSDVANNLTKTDGFIVSNNSPVITNITPKTGSFVGQITEVKWDAKDADEDPLVFQVLYRKKGREWIPLANDVTVSTLEWDTSALDNAEYELQIIANDGLSDVVAEVTQILVDNVAPDISLKAEDRIVTNNSRTIFDGTATDKLSGIQYVEYTFDSDNWYKALITGGSASSKATFEFYWRDPLPDGRYIVRTRATDGAGNTALSNAVEFIVDTSPPYIGSSLITSGALTLFPREDGAVPLLRNKSYALTLSISSDAIEAMANTHGTQTALVQNKATSLWEGKFIFQDTGELFLSVSTKDQFGNAQSREILTLAVVDGGSVRNEQNNEYIEGAEVTVSVFDTRENRWLVWDGQAFGQENPQLTDKDGQYGFLVPAGTYRLAVVENGFGSVKTGEIEVKKNTLLNTNISLAPTKGLIGKILNYFR